MTISVVQSAQAGAGGGSWAVTLGSPATAGNTLFFAAFGYSNTGATISSSSPTLGGSTVAGTLKLAEDQSAGSFHLYTAIWMLPNIPGGQTACAITVTSSNSINNVGLAVYEVSGLGASPALDQGNPAPSPPTIGNSGSTPGTAVNSGTTGAITTAPEFVIGAASIDQNTAAGASGFTSLSVGGNTNSWAGYRIPVSSGGTYSWTQTASSNANWSAVIATVKAGSIIPQQGTVTVTGTLAASVSITAKLAGTATINSKLAGTVTIVSEL